MLFLYNIMAISIHAAREGGDVVENATTQFSVAFQSTPPVKAATLLAVYSRKVKPISIHAAREGGDLFRFYMTPSEFEFQSTPPVKAAT